MPEEKKRSGVKVCGWLSDEVFSKLIEKGYKSHTIIVRHGAELIIGQPIGEHGELEPGTMKGTEEEITDHIENIREHLENTGELRELRVQVREQREHIETLKIHNETLKAELEKANRDKDDLKETHMNYMIQMQTLINQKSIEAPGVKKWWRFW
jgi:acetoin utilization deacetylase AcuC-like enzyme